MYTLRSLMVGIPILLFLGCTQQPIASDTATLERIETLEDRIAELEAQINDQQLKTRISMMYIPSNPLFNTPLQDFFFAVDELRKNRPGPGNADGYDRLSSCVNGCIKTYQERKKSCELLPEGPRRKECIDESLRSSGICIAGCYEQLPPEGAARLRPNKAIDKIN